MAEMTIETGAFAQTRLRIRDGEVEAKGPDDARWSPAPLRALAREYPVGAGPWPWLREHGVRRPAPSGASGTQVADAERAASGKRRIAVWLTPEESEALEAKRRGRSVRDTIGALLLGK